MKKKRWLRLLVAVIMICTMIPVTSLSFAEADNTITLDLTKGRIVITPTGYSQNNGPEISFTGKYIITGKGTGDTPLEFINDTESPAVFDVTLVNAKIIAAQYATAVRLQGDAQITLNVTNYGNSIIKGGNHEAFKVTKGGPDVQVNIINSNGAGLYLGRQDGGTPCVFGCEDSQISGTINGVTVSNNTPYEVPHTHKFDQNIVSEQCLKTPGSCTENAVYYKSCICGEKGTEEDIFEGDFNHVYDANGFCQCGYEPANLNGDVYEIANTGQLYWFAKQVNDGNRAINARVTKDLDLSSRPWTSAVNYDGTFDGNGKTISGLNGTNGLFSESSGIIKNVILTDVKITGKENQGNLGAIAGVNTGTIEACKTSGNVEGLGSKSWSIGGITGHNNGGTIKGCISNCTVSGSTAGGLVGSNFSSGSFGKMTDSLYYGSNNRIEGDNIYGKASSENVFVLKDSAFISYKDDSSVVSPAAVQEILKKYHSVDDIFPIKYTVSYKDGGNEAFSGDFGESTPPVTHTYGTETELVNPVKKGYIFGGWYRDPLCAGTPVTTLEPETYIENITLYAAWKECSHADSIDKPTHTESAVCSICGAEIEALGHTYGEDWIYDEANHWHECECGEKSEVTEHAPKRVNVKEATETETGYTGDVLCEICGYEMEKGKEIPVVKLPDNPDTDKPDNQDKPNNGQDKPDNDESSKTGDDSNMAIWFALMLASAVAGGTVIYRRKNQNN